MQLPNRSTLAAGLVGLIGWAVMTFAFPALGLVVNGPEGMAYLMLGHLVTPPQVLAAIGSLATLASHYVPDSLIDHAKALDIDVKDLAKLVPGEYEEYPNDPKTVPATTNINKNGR